MDFGNVVGLVIPEGEVIQITQLLNGQDEHLIYRLGTTKFTGNNYVNTGINLCSYPAYTVLIDFQLSSVDATGNMVLDNMKEESPWPGWSLDYNRYGELRFSDTSAQLKKIANNLARNRIVIRCSGGEYTVFSANLENGGAGDVLDEDVGHSLYVGAYYNLGEISRYMTGVVYSLEIYDEAWSDEKCKTWRGQS